MLQKYQTVGQKSKIDRTMHVWYKKNDPKTSEKQLYKCVICGGVTSKPSASDVTDFYETLTDEERSMCTGQ